jgi:hypothetical protein
MPSKPCFLWYAFSSTRLVASLTRVQSFLCAVVSLFGIFKLTVPNGAAWLLINLIFDPLVVIVFMHNPALDTPNIANWGECDGHGHGFPGPGFEARCDRFANAIRAAILVGIVFEMVIM